MKKYLIMLLSAICLCMTPVYALESPVQKSAQMYRDAIVWKYKNIGYISKMVNSRNRINEKIIFLHVSNTEEICDLMHSFLD